MNTVSIIGRLTRDPKLKETRDGLKISEFTLAVSDYSSKEDRTDFLNVTTFGRQAENVEKYLRKGFLTGVSGKMRSDSYEDKEGIKRYPVSIIADRVQFLQWPDEQNIENERKVSSLEPEIQPEDETEDAFSSNLTDPEISKKEKKSKK